MSNDVEFVEEVLVVSAQAVSEAVKAEWRDPDSTFGIEPDPFVRLTSGKCALGYSPEPVERQLLGEILAAQIGRFEGYNVEVLSITSKGVRVKTTLIDENPDSAGAVEPEDGRIRFPDTGENLPAGAEPDGEKSEGE